MMTRHCLKGGGRQRCCSQGPWGDTGALTALQYQGPVTLAFQTSRTHVLKHVLKDRTGRGLERILASYINGQEIINFFPKGRVKLQVHKKQDNSIWSWCFIYPRFFNRTESEKHTIGYKKHWCLSTSPLLKSLRKQCAISRNKCN